MIRPQNLDASIARLDMALVRTQALPTDPVTTEELVLCLNTFACHPLPSGLGAQLDNLIGEAVELAKQIAPAMATQAGAAPRSHAAIEPAQKASEQLRFKLLDIAAAIVALDRD